MSETTVPMERIRQAILLIRGQKVMLDRDLAALYGVETRVLNQAVKRNRTRFPADFMFELTREEVRNISQFVICSTLKHAPKVHAFTEQGVAMLSSVLRNERAILANIAIMRAFVQLRLLLASHEEPARKPAEMEGKYDAQFKVVFDAIRQLMSPHPHPRREMSAFVSRKRAPDTKPVPESEAVVNETLPALFWETEAEGGKHIVDWGPCIPIPGAWLQGQEMKRLSANSSEGIANDCV